MLFNQGGDAARRCAVRLACIVVRGCLPRKRGRLIRLGRALLPAAAFLGAPFLPSVKNIYRSDYERPNRIRFYHTGGDMKVFEGEWRLESRLDGVRVIYEARAAAPFAVPGWIARAVPASSPTPARCSSR